jgi:hypothetical protein
VTTFLDQVSSTLASAEEVVAASFAGLPALSNAIAETRAAVESSPLIMPWFASCSELAAPDAGTLKRLAYGASCDGWEMRVRSALALLGWELESAEQHELAEVAASLGDQAETMGEQAKSIPPSRENFELPPWAKWVIGVIVAREVLNVWGAIRK